MSAIAQEKYNRVVIPRWRSLRRTIDTGELTPHGRDDQEPVDDSHDAAVWQSKTSDWTNHVAIGYASDLVATASVFDYYSDPSLREAANFIIENEQSASLLATTIARRALSPETPLNCGDFSFREPADGVRSLKKIVRNEMRNPLAWAELARLHAEVGYKRQAIQAMTVALGLSPNSRYILRSAARLFTHFEQPDRGHYFLHRSDRTRQDPWLMSAEIAVASLLGYKLRNIRKAKAMIEGNDFSPFDLNELSSAVGTVEMRAGNRRRAQKLFQRALQKPSDNTVAQAEWVSRNMSSFELDPRYLETPLSYEARAWDAFSTGSMQKATAECQEWLNDEPFSRRASILGSFTASVEEDYRLSIEISERGLKANPYDPAILNNLIFSLASSNQLDVAEKWFRRLDRSKNEDESNKICLVATHGLLLFRRAEIDAWRHAYHKAIELSAGVGRMDLKAAATIYLAREEFLANTGKAPGVLSEAEDLTKQVNSASLNVRLETIKRLMPEVST